MIEPETSAILSEYSAFCDAKNMPHLDRCNKNVSSLALRCSADLTHSKDAQLSTTGGTVRTFHVQNGYMTDLTRSTIHRHKAQVEHLNRPKDCSTPGVNAVRRSKT